MRFQRAHRKQGISSGGSIWRISILQGCLGCQYCRNHPGECAQDDDMKHILEILDQTDILVLATPVYCFDMTGQMKIMLDRTYARGRDGAPIRKAVLLVDSVSENVHRAVTAQFETMLDYFGWGNGGIEIHYRNDSMEGWRHETCGGPEKSTGTGQLLTEGYGLSFLMPVGSAVRVFDIVIF